MTAPAVYQPTEQQFRDVGILFAAIYGVLWDEDNLETAIEWGKTIADVVDTDPLWADGKHCGDCTKEAHTCCRCLFDEFVAEGRKHFESDDA